MMKRSQWISVFVVLGFITAVLSARAVASDESQIPADVGGTHSHKHPTTTIDFDRLSDDQLLRMFNPDGDPSVHVQRLPGNRVRVLDAIPIPTGAVAPTPAPLKDESCVIRGVDDKRFFGDRPAGPKEMLDLCPSVMAEALAGGPKSN